MVSESEQYAQMLKEEAGRRLQDRIDARAYILKHDLGFSDEEREEVLGALGLTEDQLSKNLDWNEAQSLSRGGFRASMAKGVKPRTPPSRAQ